MSLEEFVREHDNDFSLATVGEEQKETVLRSCLNSLDSSDTTELVNSLSCLRILSRDEHCLDQLKERSNVSKLLFKAYPDDVSLDEQYIVEALKSLSNILFKRPDILSHLKNEGIVAKLLNRLAFYVKTKLRNSILLLDLKILFLLSGLDIATRKQLVESTDLFGLLADLLVSFLSILLSSLDYQLIVEILRVSYNLAYGIQRCSTELKKRYVETFDKFCQSLREFLLLPTKHTADRNQLISQIVNFFNVIPKRSFKHLLTQNENASFNLTAVHTLLDFLEAELRPICGPISSRVPGLEENLCPILNALTRASQANREIRKYCRAKVLPHLRGEVRKLPEEGSSLRNRLCRLLTNPSHGVSEMVAIFLFVLCKEDIGRAVKYTGFGNFAGFLARHALLGGAAKKSTRRSIEAAAGTAQEPLSPADEDSAEEYSSASTDSETEEYKHLKDEVNPVTGRWEAPHPDPMEGMTDEQKEYFAMDLVNKIDQLQRGGLIQPGRVGEDGRVKPVEHVLELLEDVKSSPKKDHSSGESD